MSDKFHPVPVERLLSIIIKQYESEKQILGIPEELFFNPQENKSLHDIRFNQKLFSPLGVAAGPHTQLAQNIVTAWLTGARYIELKTVQVLDELEISKPCIDMQDEGYNCEWSQELRIKESYNEYLDAWILIHVLNHYLGFGKDAGTIFNMSVGYNLEGIQSEKIQWFFNKMADCKHELNQKLDDLASIYPDIKNIPIPAKISDNITLSTMHGCPPDEIFEIAHYLLKTQKLHTIIKLNPTLLGPQKLRDILNASLGFETKVPDMAFDHDLKFEEAIDIIGKLDKISKKEGIFFGLKLTNTLESLNHKEVFDKSNEMMYMSGRALHPIAINLAQKVQNHFKGNIDISFSGGADCFNFADIISCNLKPVTVCSDILKPGGYMRLNQYVENLNNSMKEYGADSLNEFILNKSNLPDINKGASHNLSQYAESVLENDAYKKIEFIEPSIKTPRQLTPFDCIKAPCTETCPTNQDIPEYLFYAANKQFNQALKVIRRTNPFPSVTGMVCDHLCQTKCTRINYEKPVLIREVKRFIAENSETDTKHGSIALNGLSVAIIGAGPAGLSCAYFLALNGYKVTVYEMKKGAGGMVAGAIPAFRLTNESIAKDIYEIEKLGVKIQYSAKIDANKFDELQQKNEYIFISTGAQKASRLNIQGIDYPRVINPLELLFAAREQKKINIGQNVAIIGGGNSAMDAARTAYRLVGEKGKVTVVYRRTKSQMPADLGEIKAVIEEGVEIMELVSPVKIEEKNNKLSLFCIRMELAGKDASGRKKPVEIAGSEFTMEFDSIIPAIGQDLDIDFTDTSMLKPKKEGSYQTQLEGVFIGGDALRGASTAINAIGDGRKAAEEIIKASNGQNNKRENNVLQKHKYKWHVLKRSKKEFPVMPIETNIDSRRNFNLVSKTLSTKEVIDEASRCLHCDEFCNICETVCPNKANVAYRVQKTKMPIQKITISKGDYNFDNDGYYEITQENQVMNIADWCNECGNCTTFCPTSGAPYKDKPRICLTKQSFEIEDNCYYLDKTNGNDKLIFKSGNEKVYLTSADSGYIFENKDIKLHVNKIDMKSISVELKNKEISEFDTYKFAEMKVLLEGISGLFIY